MLRAAHSPCSGVQRPLHPASRRARFMFSAPFNSRSSPAPTRRVSEEQTKRFLSTIKGGATTAIIETKRTYEYVGGPGCCLLSLTLCYVHIFFTLAVETSSLTGPGQEKIIRSKHRTWSSLPESPFALLSHALGLEHSPRPFHGNQLAEHMFKTPGSVIGDKQHGSGVSSLFNTPPAPSAARGIQLGCGWAQPHEFPPGKRSGSFLDNRHFAYQTKRGSPEGLRSAHVSSSGTAIEFRLPERNSIKLSTFFVRVVPSQLKALFRDRALQGLDRFYLHFTPTTPCSRMH